MRLPIVKPNKHIFVIIKKKKNSRKERERVGKSGKEWEGKTEKEKKRVRGKGWPS